MEQEKNNIEGGDQTKETLIDEDKSDVLEQNEDEEDEKSENDDEIESKTADEIDFNDDEHNETKSKSSTRHIV